MSAAFLDQQLREFVPGIEKELSDLQDDTAENLVVIFEAATAAYKDFQTFIGRLHWSIAEQLGKGSQHAVLAGADVNSEWSRDRKWDRKPAMVRDITARVADDPKNLFDPEDGSVLPPAVIAERMAAALVNCVGISYGKIKGLDKLGLHADDYSTLGEWKPRVTVKR